MKKIFTLVFLLTVGLKINANPIALPTIEISELYFDGSDNWELELGYFEVNQSQFPIDSIFLYSTTDTIKLPSYEFIGPTGVFVVTEDSLTNDFHINRFADTIKVVSFIMGEPFEDVLVFGTISGASINFPRPGQSISKYWIYFVKDNSPTIGFTNDTLGMCGTIKGIFYDKFSEPVENKTFRLDNYFETSGNGEYSARVYSKPSTFNQVDYLTGQHTIQSVSMTEISFTMEPDSVIEMDIHLLDTLATGIHETRFENTPIMIYPNPVSVNERININIDLPTIAADIWLEIIDFNGKLISRDRINHKTSTISTPTKGGFYLLRIWLDSQLIITKKIIVNE